MIRMEGKASESPLVQLVESHFGPPLRDWLLPKIRSIIDAKSARELFITYSLCSTKLDDQPMDLRETPKTALVAFLSDRKITGVELGRLALLEAALQSDAEYFVPKIQQLIQMTDSKELVTILRYLSLLPESTQFASAAVDALRTNIADVFDAIALNNPYPTAHFNEQQWNQMYLKAAFMQRNLLQIQGVEQRANKELTRIISDYAHERWAASRDIDPNIWRPVAPYLEGPLIEDIERLFESSNPKENMVAALVCYNATDAIGKSLLATYPTYKSQVEQQQLTWETINTN